MWPQLSGPATSPASELLRKDKKSLTEKLLAQSAPVKAKNKRKQRVLPCITLFMSAVDGAEASLRQLWNSRVSILRQEAGNADFVRANRLCPPAKTSCERANGVLQCRRLTLLL